MAITAALLVGLGFNPFTPRACASSPTPPRWRFGAMGIPIIVGGQVTGIDPFKIGQMAGRQLPLLSVIVLFWLVAMMDGWRGIKETWPAIMVAGLSFAVTQFFTANYIGPELPDITSALVSLICLTVFLKNWKPKRIFRFDNKAPPSSRGQPPLRPDRQGLVALPDPDRHGHHLEPPSPSGPVRWDGPLVAGVPVPVKMLDKLVIKMEPIVAKGHAHTPQVYKLDILSATGTAIFLAAPHGMSCSGDQRRHKTLKEPCRAEAPDLLHRHGAGVCLVANFSGLSATPGLLAGTGVLFPFFSPFLGLAGRVPHRLGHPSNAPVLLAASHHRAPGRRFPTPCWWRQHHGRRHRR